MEREDATRRRGDRRNDLSGKNTELRGRHTGDGSMSEYCVIRNIHPERCEGWSRGMAERSAVHSGGGDPRQ
jgi:hypothetical protein